MPATESCWTKTAWQPPSHGTRSTWTTSCPASPRAFRHTSIYIRTDRGIREPRDLIGRRIGLPEYQLTAVVWARALLEDEFGFINVIVPAKLYEKNRETVKYSPFLLVEGRFEHEGPVKNVVGFRFRQVRVAELAHQSRDFR
mgnify:CR=1 FL=1